MAEKQLDKADEYLEKEIDKREAKILGATAGKWLSLGALAYLVGYLIKFGDLIVFSWMLLASLGAMVCDLICRLNHAELSGLQAVKHLKKSLRRAFTEI